MRIFNIDILIEAYKEIEITNNEKLQGKAS